VSGRHIGHSICRLRNRLMRKVSSRRRRRRSAPRKVYTYNRQRNADQARLKLAGFLQETAPARGDWGGSAEAALQGYMPGAARHAFDGVGDSHRH